MTASVACRWNSYAHNSQEPSSSLVVVLCTCARLLHLRMQCIVAAALNTGCVRVQLPCCFWSGCWAPPGIFFCGLTGGAQSYWLTTQDYHTRLPHTITTHDYLLVLGAWRVLVVRQCLRLPAVGFAQLNRVWSASTIALPHLNHTKQHWLQLHLHLCHCCVLRCLVGRRSPARLIVIIKLPNKAIASAVGPAPHRGGRKREHRCIVFALQTVELLRTFQACTRYRRLLCFVCMF
jgi:hypothetical protein